MQVAKLEEVLPGTLRAPLKSVPLRRSWSDTARDLIALTKPRISLMVMFSAATGMWLAPVHPAALQIVVMLLTTTAVVGAANSLNCFLERDVDRLMQRTAGRPLPAGRLRPGAALAVGATLAIVAVPLLTWVVNPLTGFLGALALLCYVAVYTPMKRLSPLALHIGAIPGAIPPLMGWTAATERIDAGAMALFGIMFIWQLPHFIAIALFRQDEYARAGIQVLPIRWGKKVARRHAAFYVALLLPLSLCVVPLGVSGDLYLVGATLLGLGFLGIALAGLRPDAGKRWARTLFFASLIHLTALFGLLWVDR